MTTKSTSRETQKTPPTTPLKKRLRNAAIKTPTVVDGGKKLAVVDLTQEDGDEFVPKSAKKRKTASSSKDKDEEKRLRIFRKHAPKTYLEKLSRAQGQRYVP